LDPPLSLEKLTDRLSQITGEPSSLVQPFGSQKARRVGCISGSAVDLIDEVVMAGYDTFITGETHHPYFHHASEWGINIIYGGHYGTETVGLKALSRHLEEKYGLETIFLDIPTGM
jgi:putative NIF3 family GTP cyclohydrolase 1 type 2